MKEAPLFELTQEHIMVLKNTYNKSAERTPLGLARLIGMVDLMIVALTEAEEQKIMAFNQEMPIAMQVVLATTSFTPGIYKKEDLEDDTSWVLERMS